MRDSYEYAVIRVVPRVEREEFVNVGVILFCRVRKFLDARVKLDVPRLKALAPEVDLEEITRHLELVPKICAGAQDEGGPIAALPQHERFHWLVAPRSTVLQTSNCHSGLTDDPSATLAQLFQKLVA
jgi:hypothetical protein